MPWPAPPPLPPNNQPPIPWFQSSTLATVPADGSYPGLLGTDAYPTRLQRGGSPTRTRRPEEAILSPVRPGKEESGGEEGKGAGDNADGICIREGCGGEGGMDGRRTLVERFSMTGAQFLDLVVSSVKRV